MRTILAAAMIALTACSPARPGPTVEEQIVEMQSARLTAWLDEQFEQELQMTPEMATRLGRKDNYDKLNVYTDAQQDAMLAWRQKSVDDMMVRFDRTQLDADARANFDIWSLELQRAKKAIKYRRQNYVFGFNVWPHQNVPNFLINFHRVDDVSDMEAYVSRLGQVGRVMDESVERAKAGVDAGVRMPKFQYERVIAESQKLITGQPFAASGADSPLWADAKTKIQKLVDGGKATPEQAAALTAAARKAMMESVKPGYRRLIAWAKSDVGKAPSGKVGAVTLPDGVTWYRAALELQTTTSLSPDEIHDLGLREVARIHGEMDKLAAKDGLADRNAFVAAREKRTDIVSPATDAGRAEYLRIANEEMTKARAKVPEFFGLLPKYDMVVRREPAFSEVPGGAAHASRATPDGSVPGVVYVHLLTMESFPNPQIPALMCHEGVPGHLMQGDIMVRQTGVPKFRTAYGYAAFGEGWGLYSEALCKEMGIYETTLQDFARLELELWRAVRLVVDTGIHSKGWTEDEAVKYAQDNTWNDDSFIRAEVRRFITYPGQATAYKIGMIKIQKLRAEAEEKLGDRFDIKGFHDTVIGAGSVPLSVLEKRVYDWMDTRQAKPAGKAK